MKKEGLLSTLKKGLKIENSFVVNLRYKMLKLIDEMVRRMYSKAVLELMDKQRYATDDDSIKEAKASTKKKLVDKYITGKTKKELTVSMSQLRSDLECLDI